MACEESFEFGLEKPSPGTSRTGFGGSPSSAEATYPIGSGWSERQNNAASRWRANLIPNSNKTLHYDCLIGTIMAVTISRLEPHWPLLSVFYCAIMWTNMDNKKATHY